MRATLAFATVAAFTASVSAVDIERNNGTFSDLGELIDLETDHGGGAGPVPSDFYAEQGVIIADGYNIDTGGDSGNIGMADANGVAQSGFIRWTWEEPITELNLEMSGLTGQTAFDTGFVNLFLDGQFVGDGTWHPGPPWNAPPETDGTYDFIKLIEPGGFDEIRMAYDSFAGGNGVLHRASWGDGSSCTGDLDGNGSVDGADLGLLLGAWGTDDANADLDGDGNVDGADLGLLLGVWGDC